MSQSVERSQVLRFGGFQLDLRSAELSRGGVRFQLQEQPFELLKLLLERPGEVVTRQELRERLWPDRFVDFEHSLNAAVNRLREALDDPAEKPGFIETLPRRGYRFIAPVSEGSGTVRELTKPSATPARRVSLVALILLSSLALVAGAYFSLSRLSSRPPEGRVLIAVLPFENMSQDPNQEYFSEGMTEEMMTRLGRLNPQRLGVISRTSALAYKRQGKPIERLARDLGVAYVLEGSVRQSGDQLRITARLIRTRDQSEIWAEQYQRSVGEVLAIQGDVAQSVARAIHVTLTPQEQTRLAAARAIAPEAYAAYLRGLHQLNRYTDEGFERALQEFEKAIALEPDYAPAHSRLSTTYAMLGNMPVYSPNEVYPKARTAVERALQLDPELAEAHGARAWIHLLYEWNAPAAVDRFRRAIALSPQGGAHHGHAMALAALSRFDEAIAEIELARSLDPFSTLVNGDVCLIYYFARRYEAGGARCRKVMEIDEEYPAVHNFLARIYLKTGQYDQAYHETMRARSLDRESPSDTARMERAYRSSGMPGFLRQCLQDSLAERSHGFVPAVAIASMYAALGDKTGTLEWLERAYDERYWRTVFLTVDPAFDLVHDEPRYQALVARLVADRNR